MCEYRSREGESCLSFSLLCVVLDLQLAVLNAHRKRVEPAPGWSADSRAVSREVTLVTRTRKAISWLVPRDLTTFVWTDCRQHLIILLWQDKNVVLFNRDGPARNVFSDDFPGERLWSFQFGEHGHVEPCITDGADPRSQETKCGSSDGSKYARQDADRQEF